MKHTYLDLEALWRVPYVDPYGGFEISPDGKWIAFSWNQTGQWEIYEMPIDASTSPSQITSGPGGKFSPRVSPNGDHLAYVLDMDGGELLDIYIYDRTTGKHTNLTPDSPEAIQPDFCWSPEGSQIAFISDRSGIFHTYVRSVIDGSERLVLDLPYPDWEVEWSPDGLWLAVVSETRGQDYETFIVPAEGGEAFPLGVVTEPLNAKDACWSPDSSHIAFSSNAHGFYNIGIYALATKQISWVTSGKGDKETPFWSLDGERLAYVFSEGAVASLAVLEISDGTSETYQIEPGTYYTPHFSPAGEHIVFIFDNPGHPGDLWMLSLVDGSFWQLTNSLPADLHDSGFVMPTTVQYSSLDGQSVPALLYQPHQSDALSPAVIDVHGGPTWLFQVTWDPLIQHMVSRGWVVLAPNYRGSTGYGREWQLANRFDLGGGDTDDVVTGADFLVSESLADPNRIAITGRSYGGYLTMTSLTRYPDRWAAGSAVVPFLNWFTAHINSREDLQHWDIENFGDPEKNQDLWRDRSPFFFLDLIQAPVQLICGAHDPRCPASESIDAHNRLLALQKEVSFHLYHDEGHSFLKTENVVDAEVSRVSFLAQALEK